MKTNEVDLNKLAERINERFPEWEADDSPSSILIYPKGDPPQKDSVRPGGTVACAWIPGWEDFWNAHDAMWVRRRSVGDRKGGLKQKNTPPKRGVNNSSTFFVD